jgi:hypothetical protein
VHGGLLPDTRRRGEGFRICGQGRVGAQAGDTQHRREVPRSCESALFVLMPACDLFGLCRVQTITYDRKERKSISGAWAHFRNIRACGPSFDRTNASVTFLACADSISAKERKKFESAWTPFCHNNTAFLSQVSPCDVSGLCRLLYSFGNSFWWGLYTFSEKQQCL